MFRFREQHGSGVIVKTLSDMKKGEEERREAAGVLAQVLSPWIEGNTSHADIDNNLPDIVISLKGRIAFVSFYLHHNTPSECSILYLCSLFASKTAFCLPYLELL